MKDQKDLVKVFVPKGFANEEPNLFVGINGRNYLLPRGKESMVPQAVAKEIARARAAQDAMDSAMDKLSLV